MNIKLPGVLLLSLMLCCPPVIAHGFSLRSTIKSYVQEKDEGVLAHKLSNLGLKELCRLKGQVRAEQKLQPGIDYKPLLIAVSRQIRWETGRLLLTSCASGALVTIAFDATSRLTKAQSIFLLRLVSSSAILAPWFWTVRGSIGNMLVDREP